MATRWNQNMRPAFSGNFTMTRMFHTSKDLMASAMLDAKLRGDPARLSADREQAARTRLRKA
eukprot:9413677-Heterocapsa_arctica.AAC.1